MIGEIALYFNIYSYTIGDGDVNVMLDISHIKKNYPKELYKYGEINVYFSYDESKKTWNCLHAKINDKTEQIYHLSDRDEILKLLNDKYNVQGTILYY